MTDASGEKTGQFKAYTTTKDRGKANGVQNVGYLETPRPLGAGRYVLCEIKAPAGYVRSKAGRELKFTPTKLIIT